MPRKPIIRSNEHYYHITARANNKEDFYLSKERMWHFLTINLRSLQIEYELKIGAFVLMDNHFHLLVLSPVESIDRVMYFLMKSLSLKIRKETGRINKVFGSRYKGCLITDESYLFNVYKYIYRNPVKAGLCERIEDYPFSSWTAQPAKLEPLFFAERKTTGELKWLNHDFEKHQGDGIKRSLKRTIFVETKSWQAEKMGDFVY